MTKSERHNIAVIGAGAVGSALALLFADCGHRVRLGSRRPGAAAAELKKLISSDTPGVAVLLPEEAVQEADMCLLTVSDDAIQHVCKKLLRHFADDCVVAHCSGALDSTALNAANDRGLPVCSAHPLNTFPNRAAARKLLTNTEHGTALYCEGDELALEKITALFGQAGFNAVRITQQAKPLYHAACVFACNYLTVLMDLSLHGAQAAGLDRQQFWQALQPIIQATLNNISAHGTSAALSGPIARGETETIDKHLDELSKLPSPTSETMIDAYKILARHALSLAGREETLDSTTIEKLTTLLR